MVGPVFFKRRCWRTLQGVCGAVFVLLLTFAVKSYFRPDYFAGNAFAWTWQLGSERGVLCWSVSQESEVTNTGETRRQPEQRSLGWLQWSNAAFGSSADDVPLRNFLGLACINGTARPTPLTSERELDLFCPSFFPLLLTALPVAIPLTRRFFRWLTIVSTVLFVGFVIMCARSYFDCDALAWSWLAEHHLGYERGYLFHVTEIERVWHGTGKPFTYFAPRHEARAGEAYSSAPLPRWPQLTHACYLVDLLAYPRLNKSFFGLTYERWPDVGPPSMGIIRTQLGVPFWLPLSITGIPLPALLLRRRLRRRGRPGCCVKCGYDLRATPERCPECGRAIGGQPAK